MLADCLSGRGDQAIETFKLIEPINPPDRPCQTSADPHIIPNGYFATAEDCDKGYVPFSGSSGAFPWILKTAIENILGAKADYSGLEISPCLPSSWKDAHIKRYFRGKIYSIDIIKQDDGTMNIFVDGKRPQKSFIRV